MKAVHAINQLQELNVVMRDMDTTIYKRFYEGSFMHLLGLKGELNLDQCISNTSFITNSYNYNKSHGIIHEHFVSQFSNMKPFHLGEFL